MDYLSKLVTFLHGDLQPAGMRIADWFALCQDLRACGLLCACFQRIGVLAPQVVVRQFAPYVADQQCTADRRVGVLAAFADEAKRQNLHFLVIKGMALSAVLYGDYRLRTSGDIDILVAPDDIPKADYVARKMGWIEPGEAPRARIMQEDGTLTRLYLEEMKSPYPFRSNDFLPHVSVYYYAHIDGSIDSLEIHDRFHGIPARFVPDVLWDAKEVKLKDRSFLTCSNETAFLFSALSMHEDSETLMSNTFVHGTMGIKACYDLHSWASRPDDKLDASHIRALAETLGTTEALARTLNGVSEVFPDDAEELARIITPTPSPWHAAYLDRCRDAAWRAANGVRVLQRACARISPSQLPSGCYLADGQWRSLPTVNGVFPTQILCRTAFDNSGLVCEWRLSLLFASMADRLVLQAVFILDGESADMLGLRVNVFEEGGLWQARVQKMGPETVDGHADKIAWGKLIDVDTVQRDGDLIIAFEMEKSEVVGRLLFWIPSVSEQIHLDTFRRIAGGDYMDIAECVVMSDGLP